MKCSYTLLIFCFFLPTLTSAQHLPAQSPVLIVSPGGHVPANATSKGTLRIKDGGFKTKCGYTQSINEARTKARLSGANIIRFTQIKAPDAWSTCYRMNAELYYLEDLSPMIAVQKAAADSAMRALVPDTASYALLCVYRPRSGLGTLVQYNLHVNDSMVCRVKNGGSYQVKIDPASQALLWARTEKRTEVTVDFQPGKVYFLRCAVGVGALVGRPVFDIMDDYTGAMEFNETKAEKPVDSGEDPVYSGGK
ncbi:hypothetical protein WJU16_15320 [Chitinophaga pollutisoli]|uniref:DUF4397 domain-containing protein n=1 Tax=Chitinophaga pollutisoli TaxID=3133966 RepID=A0ABZ2YI22_9BACT